MFSVTTGWWNFKCSCRYNDKAEKTDIKTTAKGNKFFNKFNKTSSFLLYNDHVRVQKFFCTQDYPGKE